MAIHIIIFIICLPQWLYDYRYDYLYYKAICIAYLHGHMIVCSTGLRIQLQTYLYNLLCYDVIYIAYLYGHMSISILWLPIWYSYLYVHLYHMWLHMYIFAIYDYLQYKGIFKAVYMLIQTSIQIALYYRQPYSNIKYG